MLRTWEIDPQTGLTTREAEIRLEKYGRNQLRRQAPRSRLAILASQFKGVVVALLIAATAFAFAIGDATEALAILVVILINAAIGFVTEMKAMRSMEALHKLGVTQTRVRRESDVRLIPAEEVVPGDVVMLEGGDIVTADLRLIQASKLQADESALTGESMPVSKQLAPLSPDTPLPDRTNMLYKGTSVTRGSGEGVVVGTGMDTELGEISALVAEAEDETTPLERQLNQLGGRLVWVILLITAVVAVAGVLRGRDTWLMVETGIALAVASIPEGLPIVATVALSRGMLRMARRHAIVRRLHSVETLGSTRIICTDKTGTLTENELTLTRVRTFDSEFTRDSSGQWRGGDATVSVQDDELFERALELAVLCNNATLGEEGATGDPLEIALLHGANEAGLDVEALQASRPKIREEAFDSDTKKMATYHQRDGKVLVAVKGAPEAVLEISKRVLTADGERELDAREREAIKERNKDLGREGFRIIAAASRTTDSAEDAPYENLVWIALLGMMDPPRLDIRPTIDECHGAGIRVVMVTGDQSQTASYVAREVGIVEGKADALDGACLDRLAAGESSERERILQSNVFSRVSPGQKLRLIELHQAAGNIVAMTGDGVNDAPALKKADIGVAMGLRGTQVAREVADVVLTDDAFKTIVYAVREGRVIYGNIRKFVLYLLSCNIAEILVIFLASLTASQLPILPLQILFLNFVTDVFPAFALGASEGHKGVMERPPRPPGEPVLTRRHWTEIGIYGLFISGATLLVFFLGSLVYAWSDTECVTATFLTLAAAQLWHVFNMREPESSFFNNQVTRNKYVWAALVLCLALLALAVYLPPLAAVLETTPIPLSAWALVAGCSLIPVLLDRILRLVYPVAVR